MQCVTPMIREYEELPLRTRLRMKEKGIPQKSKVKSRAEVKMLLQHDENYFEFVNRFNEYQKKKGSLLRYQVIPCGHCWACDLTYSAQWATRIMCEVERSEHNYFITLTYDDENLPIAEALQYDDKIFENDGTWSGTLQEKDVRTFINSLRKYLERKYNHTGLKYFYCGEYGTQTLRPHYHMILMNCPLDISQFYDSHVDGNFKAHWKSHELEKYWQKGMHDIAEVEWSSAAYVARYCMKKLQKKISKEEMLEIGKIPEFVRMSRRPGIGTTFYEENKEKIYANDEMIMRTVKGNVGSIKPPKVWDRRLEQENPTLYEQIKESRRKAKDRADILKKQISDYTDLERLKLNKERILEKGKMLPRLDM